MKFLKINKVLSCLDKNQKKRAVTLITIMFFATISELFGLGLVILIINSFFEIENNFTLPFGIPLSLNSMSINFLLSILIVIFTIKYLIFVLVSFLESSFMASINERLSYKMFQNFLHRDTSNLLKKNSAEYLRNFTEEVKATNTFYNSLLKIILDLTILIFFIIFLLFYNPIVTISVILFFISLSLAYFFLIKDRIVKWSITGLANKKKRIQFVNESFSAIKFIKMLSNEESFLKKFKFQNFSLSRIGLKMMFLQQFPKHTLEYILFLSIILLIFLAHKQLSNDQIIQMLAVYTLASFRIVPIINKILLNTQNLRFTTPSFEKLFLELNCPIIEKKKNPIPFKFDKKLRVLIKRFNYKNKKISLLKNIDLNINKKNKIGIIGPSGSGKSTLIDIICGFQKVFDGVVQSDGKLITTNLEGWQSNIGYIPQNIVILNQSLKENILFGSNHKKFSDKMIVDILKKVNLEYFLKKLPNGLNQLIKQDGLNISGGEKQRIGIARALLNNPEIIILDEATSGLDTFTESKVIDTINKFKKTIIIVSHRINTLKFCDKVYSIERNTLKLINKSQLN
tara:strand:+ start:146 stop:1855 length:1710 start_codon:yes stop_codon:yes gene_type:complete